MKKLNLLFLFLTLPLLVASCQQKYGKLPEGVYAEFQTSEGTFLAKLYHDATPLTVANFVALAEGTNGTVESAFKGKKYYDGLTFHRVIKDFMIQGGDPKGDGSGGPGYSFPDEFVDTLKFTKKGQLAMANAGPGTNGSQFFITLKETPHLNGRHTIFGEIVQGQEVVDAIGLVPTDQKDRPKKDVVINKVTIIKKGKAKVPYFTEEMKRIETAKKEKEERIKKVADAKSKEFEQLRAKGESLDSGVTLYFNNRGDGEKPSLGDPVMIYYAGYLSNGKLFDSNVLEVVEKYEMVDEMRKAAGQYIPMRIEYSMNASLIPGFKEAMLAMKKGDKVTAFIPQHLAYGSRGISGIIPPNSELIFEIEIVE